MLNRLILKVTKFQLPPPKRLGTVVKNILGGHHAPPPCQIGLIALTKPYKCKENKQCKGFIASEYRTTVHCHCLLLGAKNKLVTYATESACNTKMQM